MSKELRNFCSLQPKNLHTLSNIRFNKTCVVFLTKKHSRNLSNFDIQIPYPSPHGPLDPGAPLDGEGRVQEEAGEATTFHLRC